MDIRTPRVDGIEAARRIGTDDRLWGVRVVMLTTFDSDEHIFDALRAGVAGFLLKDAQPDELRHAVRAAERTSVSRLLAKLNARDQAQLVIVAYQAGLVQAPP